MCCLRFDREIVRVTTRESKEKVCVRSNISDGIETVAVTFSDNQIVLEE